MKLVNYLFFTACSLMISDGANSQIITTVAGGDSVGLGDGGPAVDCELFHPISIAFDTLGNYYITDRDHNRIRMVNTSGIIATIAGTGTAGFSGDNGPAALAELNRPYGIALDKTGNIYVTDGGNGRIRKINVFGTISTIAGNGSGTYSGDNVSATTVECGGGGIAVDNTGNIYIADFDNNRVRKIDILGIITTVAGNGTPGYNGEGLAATSAEIYQPNYVAVDNSGNIYIAEVGNERVRKIDASGIITTLAGNGTAGYGGDNSAATNATLQRPLGVSIDELGNVYIADTYNNVIRKVNASGIITTIAGNAVDGYGGDGGPAVSAKLFNPVGIAFDKEKDIYIADVGNLRIRRIQSTVFVPQVNNESRVQIYPNPSESDFNISLSGSSNGIATIYLTDITGHKIEEVQATVNFPITVHVDGPPGVYLLYAVTPNGTFSEQLVKAK